MLPTRTVRARSCFWNVTKASAKKDRHRLEIVTFEAREFDYKYQHGASRQRYLPAR